MSKKKRKPRRVRCHRCRQLFESVGKCIRCGRWLCDDCFWPNGEHVGVWCADCKGTRQRKKTTANCVQVEFKGQSVIVPVPRSRRAVDRFHELSDFQQGLTNLVLAAVKESYREQLPITIRAERFPLTQLGPEWDGWE